jgi:transcriptional regulator with XRE-family HTH domain
MGRLTGNSQDGRMPICAVMPGVIRKERKSRGVSQYVLARNGGISREMLRLVENGSSVPSLETLARICAVLKVRMSKLVVKAEGRLARAA